MLVTETRHFQQFARMRDLGLRFADRLPATAAAFTVALAALLNHLALLAGSQTAAAGRVRGCARVKRTAREALRSEMQLFCRIAAVVANETPGFDDDFQMPSLGDAKLLAAGRKFGELAAPVSEIFVKHGLPADSLDELNRRVQGFDRASSQYTESIRAATELQQQIDKAMQEAAMTAARLDALVRHTLGSDPVAITDWEKACEFPRAKPTQPEEPAPPEQPPAPAPSGA